MLIDANDIDRGRVGRTVAAWTPISDEKASGSAPNEQRMRDAGLETECARQPNAAHATPCSTRNRYVPAGKSTLRSPARLASHASR